MNLCLWDFAELVVAFAADLASGVGQIMGSSHFPHLSVDSLDSTQRLQKTLLKGC